MKSHFCKEIIHPFYDYIIQMDSKIYIQWNKSAINFIEHPTTHIGGF